MPSTQFGSHRVLGAWAWRSMGLLACLVLAPLASLADARDQAVRMHERLVGVPPDPTTIAYMVNEIQNNGDPVAAAELALEHPAFYNVALKNFVAPWTNVEQTVYVPLNDYIATVIGMIRDDVPFDQVLSGDILYKGVDSLPIAPYSISTNDHYAELESSRLDLSSIAVLEPATQSEFHPDLTPADAAGVVTTRAAAEAFFSAGTNRRMWRFTSMNYLCRDLEQMHDTSRPADRVRQDVNRSPGGDSVLFHTQCVGCHAGQDGLAGAYAYYEWDEGGGQLVHTPGLVQGKFLINDNTFAGGYVTVDDSWVNFWRDGPNAALGWGGGPDSGNGAASLGSEVAATRAFSLCQVEKVFEAVCFRPPQTAADATEIERVADLFEAVDPISGQPYRMKTVFSNVAAHCRGN